MTTEDAASVRAPAVAGMFYPDAPDRCRASAQQFVRSNRLPIDADASRSWRGALVPHAGWICSGAIAGEAIGTLADWRRSAPDVVVVFGAIHTPLEATQALLAGYGAWRIPTGDLSVDSDLSARALESRGLFGIDDRFHRNEHAVEVELPLVQQAWPAAKILPVQVPVLDNAADIGREMARLVQREGRDAVYLASSDLTHYGPAYRFMPAGVGPAALQWAKENDRRVLELIEQMQPDEIVREVRDHLNACGPGAIAAMLAACEFHGATHGVLLHHANSVETLAEVSPQSQRDAVGYAAIVIG